MTDLGGLRWVFVAVIFGSLGFKVLGWFRSRWVCWASFGLWWRFSEWFSYWKLLGSRQWSKGSDLGDLKRESREIDFINGKHHLDGPKVFVVRKVVGRWKFLLTVEWLRLIRLESGDSERFKQNQRVIGIDFITGFWVLIKEIIGSEIQGCDTSTDWFWVFRRSEVNQGYDSTRRLCIHYSPAAYISGTKDIGQNHHFFFSTISFGFFLSVLRVCCCSFSVLMAQARIIGKGGVEGSKGSGGLKMKIKIPYFDNSALIAGYAKTIIGRCMNPRMQDMKALLFMFPRIWQLEGRVVGADLGLGRFQFDFDHEEDIAEVLKMEPFHFDYWMVSMVRWKPSVDPSYPSLIRFWIRVLGIPIEYWAEPTFRGIGEALGADVAVDVDGGRIQVTLDGFKPLVFESSLEFGGGEETNVKFHYERLFGFCKVCHSLRHDSSLCPQVIGEGSGDSHDLPPDDGEGKKAFSYKMVVVHDRRNTASAEGKQDGDSKGKALMGSSMAEGKKYSNGYGNGGSRGRQIREGPSKPRRFNSYVQAHNNRFMRSDQRDQLRQHNEVMHEEVLQERVLSSDISSEKGKSKAQKALLFQGEQQHVFEAEPMEQAQVTQGLETGMSSGLEVGYSEEAPKVTRAGEVFADSLLQGFLSNEGNGESVSSLLAEVEDSLPLMQNHEEGEILADQFPTDQFGTSNNLGSDQFTDLSLLEAEFSDFDTIEDVVDHGTEVLLDKGKGKEQTHGKKKVTKGGAFTLKGVSTRKRNVQAFTTPRKRVLAKAETATSHEEGLHLTHQGTEKGAQGGETPPNRKG